MKLIPYKKVLKYTKEKIQEGLAPIRALQARKSGELEMAKIDEEIATKQTQIQELCTEHPINFHKIADALDRLGLLERRQKQFAKIIKELFEEDEEEAVEHMEE